MKPSSLVMMMNLTTSWLVSQEMMSVLLCSSIGACPGNTAPCQLSSWTAMPGKTFRIWIISIPGNRREVLHRPHSVCTTYVNSPPEENCGVSGHFPPRIRTQFPNRIDFLSRSSVQFHPYYYCPQVSDLEKIGLMVPTPYSASSMMRSTP
ncbi:hypothetical protein BJX76DRAFT_268769 [Aspergillus varians]